MYLRKLILRISIGVMVTLIIFIVIIFLRSQYNTSKSLSYDYDSNLARQFIESKGYKVVSYTGCNQSILKNSDLISTVDFWGLQQVDPFSIINQEVKYMHFEIKNHPLDSILYQLTKYLSLRELRILHLGTTRVVISCVNHKILGGTSTPNSVYNEYGFGYSLDGRKLDEVTGMKYADFQDKWIKKIEEYKQKNATQKSESMQSENN